METTTKSLSETHYIDAFFFEGGQVVSHKLEYYNEVQAYTMYQRILNKYTGSDKEVLVVLRTTDHELVKSEWLKQKGV